MSKVQVQLPRYLIRKTKSEAIATLSDYIRNHTDEFKDGEEIVLRYKGKDGLIVSANAVIDNVERGRVSFDITENDTLKIVEQEVEPQDKDVLWLSETADYSGETSGNIRGELNTLKKELKTLQEIVNRHEYSFTNALSGGNIKSNATKYSLSNLAAQEEPERTEDIEYAEDTAITEVKILVGKYELDSEDSLFIKQTYYLNVRAYNEDEEEVSLKDCIVVFELTSDNDARIGVDNTLYCEEEGTGSLFATIILPDSGTVTSNTYGLTFTNQEEPQYYDEPTYHQFITKNAKDFNELLKYIDNLAIDEFCWCIAEETLYYRAKAANGTVQLFKINGGGSEPVTPSITYEINEEGILIITSESSEVNIDENGILHLKGEIDENGILHLNNQ